MERKYLALNSALLFWLLALLAWCYAAWQLAWLFAALSVLAFTLPLLINLGNVMFKKNKMNEIKVPNPLPSPPVLEKEPTATEKHGTTVIATDVRVEGNIVSTGHVYVHGELIGNIASEQSLIKIMRGGRVEGNITCRELIIDGTVIGECNSDAIEICENGELTGTLSYRALAVKKGGIFSGIAEMLPAAIEKNNVVGLIKDIPANAPEACELAK
ncbi:polymer-forming cytoskeletal protein [Enterobacter pasteurii]|uniref:bactofilin family protein n=1 Tax=Enterobacter pasteurii TaxID=3029761 RepID=UPI0011DDFB8C|nr:polymer-forming cytoskeletal protein [Enterobacter pasteurii]QLA70417.1 polymer-forming cytoskeletal protein [Enterobacter pasteurii]